MDTFWGIHILSLFIMLLYQFVDTCVDEAANSQ